MAAPKKKVGRLRSTPEGRLTPEELRDRTNKKFGIDMIITGSQLKGQVIPRATTGSLALDYMLGGGWPLNQWNQIIGERSSGKTMMVMQTVAENQRLNPNYYVLWIASEHFVTEWAETVGIDMDRIYIVDSNVIEDCYETVIEWLDNRACDCIVIDSLPAMVPRDEDEGTMVDWHVGLAARLNGQFFRKAGPVQKRNLTSEDRDCLLLIINQWRMKIGVTYGDPRTAPGGQAKDFYYFTDVEVRRDDWIEVDDVRVGITMAARTTKNKSGPVQRTAVVDVYYEGVPGHEVGRYDIVKDIVNMAIFRDVIVRGKPRYSYKGRAWSERKALEESVRNEPELREALRYDVLRASGMPIETTAVEVPELVPAPKPRAPRKPAAAAKKPAAKAVKSAPTKKIIKRV